MPSISKILFRLVTPIVILILLWSQSSFVVLQVSHFIHYQEVRQSHGHALSKFRDTIIIDSEAAKTLVWIKDDEIKYKGKMFDVKRQLHRGDKVLLVGHYDNKDDEFLSAINSFFELDDNGNDKDSNSNSMPHLLVIEAILANVQFDFRQFYPGVNQQEQMKPSLYRYSMSNTTFQPPEVA